LFAHGAVEQIADITDGLDDDVGFYTAWLMPAAVVGLLVFLFGVFTISLNNIAYVSSTASLSLYLSLCLSVCMCMSVCTIHGFYL